MNLRKCGKKKLLNQNKLQFSSTNLIIVRNENQELSI